MIGVTLGFFLGLGLLYGVEKFTQSIKEKLPPVSEYHINHAKGDVEKGESLPPDRLKDVSDEPATESSQSGNLSTPLVGNRESSNRNSRSSMRLSQIRESFKKALPWPLIFPVVVDCLVGGFLVGIGCGISPGEILMAQITFSV